MTAAWFIVAVVPALLVAAGDLERRFDLPRLPPPYAYGTVVIDRTAAASHVKPVTFSHASHRVRFTCRVCHLELGFALERNVTEITEQANRRGEYCGACHNGTEAFGNTPESCERCHGGDRSADKARFASLGSLPAAKFGNEIDWLTALRSGAIKPAVSLQDDRPEMSFSKTLVLEAEWAMIPPAEFPHEAHNLWLDCANCHPDPFNIQKKTTKHFAMSAILAGKFCGACHLRVAFPLNDCRRCHPRMS